MSPKVAPKSLQATPLTLHMGHSGVHKGHLEVLMVCLGEVHIGCLKKVHIGYLGLHMGQSGFIWATPVFIWASQGFILVTG